MKKILVIDDDELILKTYGYMLTSLNYEVSTTSDSTKGLELALKQDFDLILTDFNMPILNGIELIKELKKVKSESKIYISSGGMNSDQLQQVNNVGASGILEKPFSISKIVALLD